jgi:hypothetical protein
MSSIVVAGDTSGSITIAAPAVAGSGTLTLPVATDTLIGKATTDTLTNKSIAASQLTGTIAAAALPAGSVIQVVNSQTGAVATGTTLIPNDDTIPQITEGNEYMTLAITPTSATSLLEVTVTTIYGSNVNNYMCVALFRDAGANALATGFCFVYGDMYNTTTYSYRVVAGSVSATTFRVRIGGNNAGTTTFNGRNGARLFGGTMASSITIKEYVA